MANIVKSFINHYGLDLKSSNVVREPQFATGMQNSRYNKDGNLSKREGYRCRADSAGGNGLFNYVRIIPETAKVDDQLLSVSDKLHVYKESTIVITYSGAELSVVLDIFFDPDTGSYKCQIVEGTTTVLDFDMGVGVDEISPVTLADLKTAIDAVTDYSATITGPDTVPAAYLDLIRSYNLFGATATLTAGYWEDANSSLTSPFPGNLTNADDEDYENTSFVQLNNNVYMSNGYDEVQKYDGQNVYRAGMPEGVAPVAALGGAGALSWTVGGTGYQWSVVYTQFDANGNLVTGNQSELSNGVIPAAQSVDLTIDNILAASGFNTNCAVVAGAQVSVNTITVDDGSAGAHTLLVGDTAYFFDSISGDYVERKVTSITPTSITVAGAAVTVADNDVISNNLRIGIYRNMDGGTFQFLVAEIPNNSFAATQTYNDNVADGSLGLQFVEPLSPHDPPPKGRYLASYNNQLFSSGNLDNPNTVSWSAVESPEYFAPAVFSIITQSPNGDKIKGLRQSNEVMTVFEKRATHIISGDIPNNNIRVDTITKDIGCVSHHSISEVQGVLYFLSDRGVWKTVSGQLPIEVSDRIEPVFDIESLIDEDQKPVLNRSIAINDRNNEHYVLYVPSEQTISSVGIYANDFSRMYVEDYNRAAWLEWNNMNMAGGAVIYRDKIWFVERRRNTSGVTGDISHYLYKTNNRGDNYDFQDNTDPINWEYKTAWYNFQDPSVFKKYLRYKIFASEETANNEFVVSIDIEKDFIENFVIGNFVIDFSGAVGGYGVSAYGTAPYGDVFEPNRKYKIGPIKSRALRFVMTNSEPLQNIDITGWEVEVAMPYRQELKE